ncbi:glycosyltransferase family 15 protein [Dichomitus squalens]|uniref:Glycosyltransferase family 15 protein n=1 Tax=Dichomitus squalens TaxID=114155 RepID=A0A4Q9MFT7_9APHY|nr:glycosyltransferase family 15 protein [Dichomitus squalens]
MTLKFNSNTRRVLFIAFIGITIHSILSYTHEEYGRVTSLQNMKVDLSWGSQSGYQTPVTMNDYEQGVGTPTDQHEAALMAQHKANATILMLARNSDVDSAVRSAMRLEDKFNSNFGYPWVFLNEEPFSDEFKLRIGNVVSGEVKFGQIPREHWFQPDWIDEEYAKASRDELVSKNVIYGGSVSYRNMCRFNSGFFFRHPLLQEYKWYWRVEPDVNFPCHIDYDPFQYMETHNKTYGFTITLPEYVETIPTLWDATKEFTAEHPEYVAQGNSMGYLSENNGDSYNNCHFWSNFEIADMDFWRGEAYMKYFEHLDSKGGFYYERWGDAPVHSIAAGLFQGKDKIHFFDDIGYGHAPFTHCPHDDGAWARGKCSCNPDKSFDYEGWSCLKRWERIFE